MDYNYITTAANQYPSPATNCSRLYNPYETYYDSSSPAMPAMSSNFYDRQIPSYSRRHRTSNQRCWNCWSLNHHRSHCPETRRTPQEVEELRIRLGVPKPTSVGYILPDNSKPFLCFNCWEDAGHLSRSCPEGKRDNYEREKIRVEKGMPLVYTWRRILEQDGIEPLDEGSEEEDEEEEEEDEDEEGSVSFDGGSDEVGITKRGGMGSWRKKGNNMERGGGVKLGDFMQNVKSPKATTVNGDGTQGDSESKPVDGGGNGNGVASFRHSPAAPETQSIPVHFTESPFLQRGKLQYRRKSNNYTVPHRVGGWMNHQPQVNGGDGAVDTDKHKDTHVEILTQISNHLGHLTTAMDEINVSLKTLVKSSSTNLNGNMPVTPVKPPHPLVRVNSLAHLINARVNVAKPIAAQNGIFSTPEKHSLYHELGDITKRLAALEASCDLAMDDSATMQDGNSEEESFTSID